jgi:hypothetical protein
MKDNGILLIPTDNVIKSNLLNSRRGVVHLDNNTSQHVKEIEANLIYPNPLEIQTTIITYSLDELINENCILVGTIQLHDMYNIYIKNTANKDDKNIVVQLNYIKNQMQSAIQYPI